MAAEVVLSGSLEFDNGTIADALSKAGLRLDSSGTQYIKNVQSVGTSEEAIILGEVTAPGHYMAINLDNTNFVTLHQATGANSFAELEAKGGFAIFKWSVASTAPFIKADTAACKVAYLLLNRS